MIEIFDDYCWEDHKKVIPHDQHGIPGLGNFAYWSLSSAVPPTPLHHHKDIVELHCVIKGKRECWVDDKVYAVTGNELFLTFPFEPHSSGAQHQPPCSFYGLQITIRQNEELLGLNRAYSNALREILTTLPNRHFSIGADEMLLLKLAFQNISDGNIQSLYLGVQYLCCFLFRIPDLVPVKPQSNKKLDPYITKVLEYIEEHYREEIHLKELAVLAGYSLSRFKIKFKEEVGNTPANYITFRKLEYAKQLLESTQLPITQIALDAGFSSSNYFCTVLKRYMNMTPTKIREDYRRAVAKKRLAKLVP